MDDRTSRILETTERVMHQQARVTPYMNYLVQKISKAEYDLKHRFYIYHKYKDSLKILYALWCKAYQDNLSPEAEDHDVVARSAVGILHEGSKQHLNITDADSYIEYSIEEGWAVLLFADENNHIGFSIAPSKPVHSILYVVIGDLDSIDYSELETIETKQESAMGIFCIPELTDSETFRIPKNICEITIDAEKISGGAGKSIFSYRPDLRKIHAPKLTEIDGGIGFYRCYSLEIDAPKLERITNMRRPAFFGNHEVVLPETLDYVDCCICDMNYKVILNCKDISHISDDWYYSSNLSYNPPHEFVMCDDWGASINISIAAEQWTKEQFIDLFTNKLRDMGTETRTLKIPSAIYESLTDEEFEIAENKGWVISS